MRRAKLSPKQLLNFFDAMGFVDNRVTLEEMISGFRMIRREWATIKAEKAGRAVLAKVVHLMGRAGMSLEDWFRFMDMSQVKLTTLRWMRVRTPNSRFDGENPRNFQSVIPPGPISLTQLFKVGQAVFPSF